MPSGLFCPDASVTRQAPLEHVPSHVMPQPPQLAVSVSSSTQAPPAKRLPADEAGAGPALARLDRGTRVAARAAVGGIGLFVDACAPAEGVASGRADAAPALAGLCGRARVTARAAVGEVALRLDARCPARRAPRGARDRVRSSLSCASLGPSRAVDPRVARAGPILAACVDGRGAAVRAGFPAYEPSIRVDGRSVAVRAGFPAYEPTASVAHSQRTERLCPVGHPGHGVARACACAREHEKKACTVLASNHGNLRSRRTGERGRLASWLASPHRSGAGAGCVNSVTRTPTRRRRVAW